MSEVTKQQIKMLSLQIQAHALQSMIIEIKYLKAMIEDEQCVDKIGSNCAQYQHVMGLIDHLFNSVSIWEGEENKGLLKAIETYQQQYIKDKVAYEILLRKKDIKKECNNKDNAKLQKQEEKQEDNDVNMQQ